MKQIALVTRDFTIYHTILAEARARGIDLLILTPGEKIPEWIEAVITTPTEACEIDFDPEKIITTPLLNSALELIRGGKIRRITIGIDPGKFPGIAVLGDRRVLEVHHVEAKNVTALVKRIIQEHQDKEVLVRIGHGDRLIGSQITNSLLEIARVELVNETGTTPLLGKGVQSRVVSDIVAAVNIALTPGQEAEFQSIEPSPGEVRQIQEKSRKHTRGRTTIPRKLAKKVAKGELTLEEAVNRHNSQ